MTDFHSYLTKTPCYKLNANGMFINSIKVLVYYKGVRVHIITRTGTVQGSGTVQRSGTILV
ncbi:hypothetical protein DPMN_128983 [Dreissena polymorpha]|uniref:Uncharacterized protein n=1 Tax=Dreissena polymorpha TaxID=45954 RepID=A0A9D4H4X6_DREPO|nr:hypothetical protein DPMN_128983 [Dreissena polymorpha]